MPRKNAPSKAPRKATPRRKPRVTSRRGCVEGEKPESPLLVGTSGVLSFIVGEGSQNESFVLRQNEKDIMKILFAVMSTVLVQVPVPVP
jgi:hypothetical protein